MNLFEDLTEERYLYDDEGFTDVKEDVRGGYIPNHLSSPITIDDCDFLLSNDNFFCKRHIEIKKLITEKSITRNIYHACKDPYICLYNFTVSEEVNSEDLDKGFDMTFLAAKTGYRIQLLNYLENSISTCQFLRLENSIDNYFNQITISKNKLFPSYRVMKQVEKIKEVLCLTRVPFGKLINHRNILAERDIFVFSCLEHGSSIGPTNLLLCVLDIHQSRFTLLLYFLLCDIFKKYPYSLFDHGIDIINTFEKLRFHLGKKIFKLLSNWETLMVGYAINDSEKDLGFSMLYESTFADMKNVLNEHNLEFPNVLVPKARTVDYIKMYIELTGLVKHFGHPCLDIDDGFNVVKLHGCEKKLVNQNIVKIAVGIFVRDFIKEYYNKKGRWPPLDYCPEELKIQYDRNIYPGRKLEKNYSSWEQIQFSRIFDYDYSPDTTELLKDSAAAADLDQWFTQYDHCAFKILYNKSKPKLTGPLKPTRVIERYLVGSEEELKHKIWEVENNYFDKRDLTAVLCRKEQELNPNGRMFVKQPYIQRLMQTSMENNTAKQLMKYVPEQTMTDGEIQQMRRLTDAAKYQGRDLEIFNLDLSKWNLKFRHALVAPFGRKIDQMFGFNNLYSKNHYWFLKAYVFNNSRLYPPDYDEHTLEPLPGKFFYNNHLGGMEGMRQKLWTIITICLIKLSAEKSGLAIDIMCQGDNQVVMIRYRPGQVKIKETLRERFLTNLTDDLNQVNLVLKREETWFSIRLCEFGKVRFFEGEAISAGIKKVYRLIPDINDGVCSIMSSLSTINTITESVAKYDYKPDSAFIINQFHIINYLYRKKVLNIKENQNLWNQYLFFPSDFGGVSLSTYQSHFVRGNDDKIPIWISIFQTAKKFDIKLYHRIISINQFEPKASDPQLRRLMEDIFSINIYNLPSIENTFKALALRHITSDYVTNTEVKKLFDSSTSYSIDDLVTDLSSMKPMILSIAHEILRNSNAGILLALRTRFTNIQTINKIVQKEFRRDFLDMMKHNNLKIVEILKRKKNLSENYFNQVFLTGNIQECPSKLARELRKIHWGIDMIGETRSNILHQFYIKPTDLCTNLEINNSIFIQLSSEYSNRTSCNYLKDGPYIAYLGSATKEKVKKPSLEMSTKTSYVKALQQLVLLRTWLRRLGSINLVNLIEKLIKEKVISLDNTDEDLEHEDWCGMNYGGNILHRFRAIIERNSAVINYLPTVATHFKQSTNKLAGITTGGRDYTIHFQLALLSNISRIMKIKELTSYVSPQYCSVLTCKDCTLEITDIKFDLSNTQVNIIGNEILSSGLQQETSYTISELQDFLSLSLGRQFGKSTDLIFNKCHIDNRIAFSTKSIPILNQISVNDLRYLNFDYFMIGLIQQSRIIRKFLLNLSTIDVMFVHSKIMEPFAQFLINADLLIKFMHTLKISGYEHSHLTSTDKISDMILIGLYNHFWSSPTKNLQEVFKTWFKDDDASTRFWPMKWIINIINKIGETTLDKSILRGLRSDDIKIRKQMYLKIARCLETDYFNSRARTLKETEVLVFFRQHPHRKQPEKYTPRIYPALLNYKNYNPEEYIQHYHLFWEKLLLISDVSVTDLKDFHHLYRIKGNISTAINKILEIIYILQYQFMSDISNIYCLAEGSGSILEGLGAIYPDAKLFYNTLLLPEIDNRPGPDYNEPPSILNSLRVPRDRIDSEAGLNRGNTDILSKEFMLKIISCMSRFPPDIVTIDAESGNTETNLNNFNILDKYINILIKSNVKLAIIKYFKRSQVEYIIPEYSQYIIFPFKPLTSNPCNQEVYMVILRKGRFFNLQYPIIKRINSFYNNLKIIGQGFPLYKQIIYHYISLEIPLFSMFDNFPMLSVPFDPFHWARRHKHCNTYCWTIIKCLYQTLESVNSYHRDDYAINLLIREGGLLQFLIRIIKMISILIIGTINKNIKVFLENVMTYNISKTFRSRKEIIDDVSLCTCYDLKSLLRRYSIEFHSSTICKCQSNLDMLEDYTRQLGLISNNHCKHIKMFLSKQ